MRISLQRHQGAGRPALISAHQDAVTVAVGPETVHSFDASGRWLGGVEGGCQWRRSYDHRVVGGPRGTRPLEIHEPRAIAALLGRVRRDATAVRDGLRRGELTAAGAEAAWLPLVTQVLARAADLDLQRLEADGRRYRDLYGGGIPVVPEDLRRALYLQLSVGCRWNRCVFCDLQRDRAYRSLSLAEVDAHVREVLGWYGPAVALRRSVFLGDADVLEAGAGNLLNQLAIVARHLRVGEATVGDGRPAVQGHDGFVTAGSVQRAAAGELEALNHAGFRRAYLGLETGHPPLHRAMRRRDGLAAVARAVERLRAARIAVGLTVIAGLGGQTWAAGHVADTVRFVRGLGLSSEDRVYLSPLVAPQGSAYEQWRRAGAEPALTAEEMGGQVEELRDGLQAGWPHGAGPRVAAYAVDVPPW